MPNWVYNHVSGYDSKLYDKYKSDESDIDYNKVIPEPEELTNTISGSYNLDAKRIYNHCKKIEDEEIKSNYDSPLYNTMRNKADKLYTDLGQLVLENPDKSINQIFDTDDKDIKYIKDKYDNYVNLFGNTTLRKVDKDKFIEGCDKYIEDCNKRFIEDKSKDHYKEYFKDFNSIQDFGKHCIELEEKYGFDNWYDWRNAHWGVKWNASDTSYDEETEQLDFTSPWGIPVPILAKIAQDNPEAKLEVYSEEEFGWFAEYKSEDGKLFNSANGDIIYDEDNNESKTSRTEVENPIKFNYDDIKEKYIRETELIRDRIDRSF